MTATCVKPAYVQKSFIRNMAILKVRQMGLTEDQKIDLAIAYIKKCNDVDLLIPLLNAAHDRINEIIEEEGE